MLTKELKFSTEMLRSTLLDFFLAGDGVGRGFVDDCPGKTLGDSP
jgi:hypothetical protein